MDMDALQKLLTLEESLRDRPAMKEAKSLVDTMLLEFNDATRPEAATAIDARNKRLASIAAAAKAKADAEAASYPTSTPPHVEIPESPPTRPDGMPSPQPLPSKS